MSYTIESYGEREPRRRKAPKPKKVKAASVLSEASEQALVFQWAEWMRQKYPELWMLYHVPNGGSRNPIEAVHLKAQGVKSGVPDICLPVPRGGYHGLYIEMKRREKFHVSKEQKEWILALIKQGYKARVCLGAEDAIMEITKYLKQGEKK